MANRGSRCSRRRFLQSAAASSLFANAGPIDGRTKRTGGQYLYRAWSPHPHQSSRRRHVLFGYAHASKVLHAMARASELFVEIVGLQRAVRARLASFAGTEAAMVCSGSAACISQATAGCIAGTDPDRISSLPETTGMRNEVIITLLSVWDRSLALVGAKLVLVHILQELEAAINPNRAMIETEYGDERVLRVSDAIAVAKKHKVPLLLDAAVVCPPFDRLKTIAALGPDMFNVSGGKGLFGPQCSGVLFGRKHLIQAALRNGSPYEGGFAGR